MSKPTLHATGGPPSTRTSAVLVTRAVLVMFVAIIGFVNPVVAFAISVAFVAIYQMLDVNVLNRRAEQRRDFSKER